MVGPLGALADSEDAFGSMLRDHLRGKAGAAILEVDDGSSTRALAATVFFRLRYLDRVTPWFEWLNPTPRELAEIAIRTGWDVERVVRYEDEPEAYAAILRHST